MNIPLEEAERVALNQVKFLNFVLEECRKRNKELEEKFGTAYGKLVGTGTVYEEAICSLRKVKGELDEFLNIIRADVRVQLQRERRRYPHRPLVPREEQLGD
jgi:hypothetical protein